MELRGEKKSVQIIGEGKGTESMPNLHQETSLDDEKSPKMERRGILKTSSSDLHHVFNPHNHQSADQLQILEDKLEVASDNRSRVGAITHTENFRGNVQSADQIQLLRPVDDPSTPQSSRRMQIMVYDEHGQG